MKLYKLIAALALATTLPVANAAESGVLLDFRITRSGADLGSPRIWSSSGETSTIEVNGAFKLEVAAHARGEMAEMVFSIYLDDGSGLKKVSSPRVIAKQNEQSSFNFMQEDGSIYQFAFTPSLGPQPR